MGECEKIMLTKIDETLYSYCELLYRKERMQRTDYICEHWEEYENDKKNLISEIRQKKEELICECNEFINYPTNKIWIFDFTKSVSIKYDNLFKMEYLKIPFIDKHEYYCLINYLDKQIDILWKSSDGEYLFK